MEQVCRNCEQPLTGKYCSHCGQKGDVPQFTFKHIFEEAFHAFTHADKSFLSFLQKLVVNPGKLAYEYIIERKRKQYFNPFTFFLLVTAISAFVEDANLNLKEQLFHDNNEYGHLFNVYGKILSLVIIPFFAFAIWLIHLAKRRVRYSEYTVFAMILISVMTVADIVTHSIDYAFTVMLHTRVGTQDHLYYPVLLVVYLAYANYSFHLRLQNSSYIKSIMVGISFIIAAFAIQLFTIYAFINDFHGIGKFYMYGFLVNW